MGYRRAIYDKPSEIRIGRLFRSLLTTTHFVSQAHHLLDKLLCVCGRIGVVLLSGPQCVVLREYLL
jgi:hypothetical protein